MSSKTKGILRHYHLALVVTILILLGSVIYSGPRALLPILALALIEITFSFDNAVLNSQVLGGMSRVWRTVFLTVGIAIAVFGVRLVLPLIMVSSTSGDSLGHVLQLALHQPDQYAAQLREAYPVIAAFGGIFLLMIGLRFFGERKEVLWLNRFEAPLSEFNQPWWVSLGGAAAAILSIKLFLAHGSSKILASALLGAATFMAIKLLSDLLLNRQPNGKRSNGFAAGFVAFMYLELLDASFSFDGVIAAFAITKDVLLIAAGLGIGAMYVRSMTVQLLKQGTLAQYRYLIHGAHYAILLLSVLLLISIRVEVPDSITGLLGLIIIGLSLQSSRQYNKSDKNHTH